MDAKEILNCTFEVLGTTSSWPYTDDCYRVKITNKAENTSYIADYFKKTSFDVVMSLQRVMHKISKEELIDLCEKIESYGDTRWSDGQDSATID